MQINISNKALKKVEADIEIIFVSDKKEIEKDDLLKRLNFKAKDEEVLFLPESGRLYVGCEKSDYESIAIAIAASLKKISSTNFESVKLELFGDDRELCMKAICEGAMLGSYKFDNYKSKKEEEEEKKELTLTICGKKTDKKLQEILDESAIIADAVNLTRDMVNTPPDDFYPAIMAMKASEIARDGKFECKIFDDIYLEQNGMEAMLAVSRASIHKPKLIHLTYKPKNAVKKVVLVGKGLTYDSGGLSLKPSDFMVTMKSDKSGGSAVLGIMSAVKKLKLPVEIHGIVGAVENMIGGNAYKPDDVLTARNGKTIEVRNTDAEGRLVLADCLCYAQEEIEDIDYIFDFATLTGACVVGLGEYTTGIMGNNEMLKRNAVLSALGSGEHATSLPFNRYLKKTIKSEIADICNIANTRYGGAITAGLFLENFVYEENKNKWIHFDIAGPAYVEKAWGYNPHGASGAGVRMAIGFLKSL